MSESISSISVYSSNSENFNEDTLKNWKELENKNIIDKNTYLEYSSFFRKNFKIDETDSHYYHQKISNIIFSICMSQYYNFEKKNNNFINFIEKQNSKLVFTSIFIIGYILILDRSNILEFIRKTKIDIGELIECIKKIIELYEKGKKQEDNVWNKECSKIMEDDELNPKIIEIKKIIEMLFKELESELKLELEKLKEHKEREELSSVDEEETERRVQNGLLRVNNWTWNSAASKLIEFCKKT
jgi:hypothetical protein